MSFPRKRESIGRGSPLRACGDDKNFSRDAKILVICGKGNNGGDGLVAARHLFNKGCTVHIVLLARGNELMGDAQVNYQIIKKMKLPILELIYDRQLGQAKKIIQRSAVVIDAIFGIGLKRPVGGLFAEVIFLMNQSKKPVISIDVPSGINSESGRVMGLAVKARVTGTLAAMKRGLRLSAGKKYAGRVEVLDISIPRNLLQ